MMDNPNPLAGKCPECGLYLGHTSMCPQAVKERMQRDIEQVKSQVDAEIMKHVISTLPENPKHVEAQKLGKTRYETIPWGIIRQLAGALSEGAGKYGRFNWREDHIRASTYIGAIGRHLFGDGETTLGWANGEDIDPDSGLPHLVKVMACCMLVLDAGQQGTLIDDRLATESLRRE